MTKQIIIRTAVYAGLLLAVYGIGVLVSLSPDMREWSSSTQAVVITGWTFLSLSFSKTVSKKP